MEHQEKEQEQQQTNALAQPQQEQSEREGGLSAMPPAPFAEVDSSAGGGGLTAGLVPQVGEKDPRGEMQPLDTSKAIKNDDQEGEDTGDKPPSDSGDNSSSSSSKSASSTPKASGNIPSMGEQKSNDPILPKEAPAPQAIVENDTQASIPTPETITPPPIQSFETILDHLDLAPNQDLQNDNSALVQQKIAGISNAANSSKASVALSAETTKANVSGIIDGIKQNIQATIAAEIAATQGKVAQFRNSILQANEATKASLTTDFIAQKSTITQEGETAKAAIIARFQQHRDGIDSLISQKIEASSQLHSYYVDFSTSSSNKQADEATKKGEAKASSFSADARGQKQKNAVRKIASNTAKEIRGGIPKMVTAVSDVVSVLPEEFHNKGLEAKNGLMEHEQTSLQNISDQTLQSLNLLDQQYNSANANLIQAAQTITPQIDNLALQVITDLTGQEQQLFALLETNKASITLKIEEARDNTLTSVDTKVGEATLVMNQLAEQDETIINAIDQEIVGFFLVMNQEFTQEMASLESDANTSLQTISTQLIDWLSGKSAALDGTLTQIEVKASKIQTDICSMFTTQSGAIHDGMVSVFEENYSAIDVTLNSAISDLDSACQTSLKEAEDKIQESIYESLSYNDQVLGELTGKMNEAAKDAAWRHDHPIRAALLDFASFVGGLLLGILAVLAMAVLCIIAIKLLVAGLIALGVSAAIAAIVALVIGVVLLGVGVYTSYQARIAAGAEGGWGTLGMALLDITGIPSIYQGFTQEGLTPFERGKAIGSGIATLVSFFINRKLDKVASKIIGKIPRIGNFVNNPKSLRGNPGLEGRGYKPKPGERSMTKEQWKAQHRRQRMEKNGIGLEKRGYRPKQGERTTTKEQWKNQQRQQRTEKNSVKPNPEKNSPKLATGAGKGLPPTKESIKIGTVRMEDHPEYSSLIAKVKEKGFEIVVDNNSDPHVEINKLFSLDKKTKTIEHIGTEKRLVVQENMRYIDLEHEFGHIQQLSGRLDDLPTSKYIVRENGSRKSIDHLPKGGDILSIKQNSITEYHNRLIEYISLYERGADSKLLTDHALGVAEWRGGYHQAIGANKPPRFVKKGDKANAEWSDTHFKDIKDLEIKYEKIGGRALENN